MNRVIRRNLLNRALKIGMFELAKSAAVLMLCIGIATADVLIADGADEDDDNDGLSDIFEGSGDIDGDGIANSLDSDDQGFYDFDNDGITNSSESCSISDVLLMNVNVGGTAPTAVLTDGFFQSTIEFRHENFALNKASTLGGSVFSFSESLNFRGVFTLTFSRPVYDVDILFDNFLVVGDIGNFTVEFEDGTVINNADFWIYQDIFDGSTSVGVFDPLTPSTTSLGTKDSSSGEHRIALAPTDNGFDQFGARIRLNGTGAFNGNNGVKSISYERSSIQARNLTASVSVSARFLSGQDSNGDGFPDCVDPDLDVDGDGIPNIIEGSVDSDGDGIPDYLDTDSDNDGIEDGVEVGVTGNDADGDGIDDLFDVDTTSGVDANNDGIDDDVTGNDKDNDGILDSADKDADGDGVPDIIEGSVDSDGDGISDYLDTDSDNDGIEDGVEVGVTGNDADGDGIDDLFDVDTTNGVDANNDGIDDDVTGNDKDNDGILDSADKDADGDGIPDIIEGSVDSDGDGIPDYLDTDSDNDGIEDGAEVGVTGNDADGDGIDDLFDVDTTNGVDANNDGIDDDVSGNDTDGDGILNSVDTDADGDGIPDSIEGAGDADSDGVPNNLDTDSDNDGISDSAELSVTGNDADGDGIDDLFDVDETGGADANGDGIDDAVTGTDTDGDGIVDAQDTDSENDGIPDLLEGAVDTDSDGFPNYLDLDSDGDGIADLVEAGGIDTDRDGKVDEFLDNDAGGFDDGVQALPLELPDTDADGRRDFLDLDSDNDGIPDSRESPNALLDVDGDGVIDSIVDDNNDGWVDIAAGKILLDTDEDGTPNYQDLDSDGDGVSDLSEAGGVDANADGVVDAWADIDGDGIADNVDADQFSEPDADGDGIADFADADFVTEVDSDGDGIVDRFDIDPFGDGLARAPTGEPILGVDLPDTDGDGTPDLLQASTAIVGPEGKIRTALRGRGSMGPLSLIVLGVLGLLLVFMRQQRVQLALLATLVISGCASSATPSSVTDEADIAQTTRTDQHRIGRHIYVAAGVGLSQLEPDTSEVSAFDVDDEVSAGGQIALGMDVNRLLAVELHAADLGSAGLSPSGAISYREYGASALFYAGKNRKRFKRQGLTAYGRIGVGTIDNSAEGDVPFEQENSAHLLLGVGLEYMTQLGLGVRAEFISYEEDVQYGQFALVYRFGKRPSLQADSSTPVQTLSQALDPTPALATGDSPTTLEPQLAAATEQSSCSASDYSDVSINFAFNSSGLDVKAKATLENIAQELVGCEVIDVALIGHSDSTGSDRYNEGLSQRRVNAVMDVLLQMDIDSERISTSWMGERQPAVSNDSLENRRLNRRVSIIFD